VKFGLAVCHEVNRFPEMREQARAAETLGYDSVWLPEHHLIEGYAPSPLLGLASIAAITERMHLGTALALIPFYSPVRLAEDAAVLADMSGDRFILGAGLGYREEEFAAFGIPYKQRGRRMHETLATVRQLLHSESVTFSGRFVQLEDVTIFPRPAHAVPIYVGGWSEPALRRAAELGDAWFPGPTADLDKLRSCLRAYDEALSEYGKSRTELPIFREVWVADSPKALAAGVDPLRELYMADYLTWEHGNVSAGDSEDPFDDLRRDRFIVGSPSEVAEEILKYHSELGMTHLIARMHFRGSDHREVLRSMELFANTVIPEVQAQIEEEA
jgi:probable F420-dependent oxidoreductase